MSAFVVGAIAAPAMVNGLDEWNKAAQRMERSVIALWETAEVRSEREARSEPTPLPSIEPSLAGRRDHPGGRVMADSNIVDGADVSYASRFPGYDGPAGATPVLVMAAAGLLPWFLTVILGGVLAAIVGYFMPALYAAIFRWVPRVVVAYVHWLNGPEA